MKDESCEIVVFEVFKKFQGIGTKILEKLKDIANDKGCNRIFLMTNNEDRLMLSYLKRENIPEMIDQFNEAGLNNPVAIFNKYFEEQIKQKRLVWAGQWNGKYVGYITLVWNSYYKPFLEKKIPEIKDLNVVSEFQRKGIGTALILAAEKKLLSAVQLLD